MTDTQSNPNDGRFSRRALLDAKKLRKSRTRWNQVAEALRTFGTGLDRGPILDCGCGIGDFVLEGLRRGMPVYGIDASPSKIARYRRLLEYSQAPSRWRERCLAADGSRLPLRAERFAAVCSWFVLEHVADPGGILREMVRITRPGGLLILRAEDARSEWEGHYKIPWIPFLSGSRARAWVEAFGKTWNEALTVFPVTQTQLRSILQALGCAVVSSSPPPPQRLTGLRHIADARALRAEARRLRRAFESGRWQPPRGDLYLIARKL